MKWFCLNDNFVKGPYSTEELQRLISSMTKPSESFVWTRGITDWLAADRWTAHIIQQSTTSHQEDALGQKSHHVNTQTENESPESKPASTHLNRSDFQEEDEEITMTKTDMMLYGRKHSTLVTTPAKADVKPILNNTDAEKYRVQLNFVEQPQMTKEELMQFTSQQEDVSKISIYDKNTRLWKEVYAFPEIVEKLGLTRRKHPRVPILAQFSGSSTRHEKLTARVITLSEGGIGLTDVYDMQIGDKLSGQITSPHFYTPLKLEAEVTYSGHDGYVGLAFTQINDDAKSLIMDYVRRFSHNS